MLLLIHAGIKMGQYQFPQLHIYLIALEWSNQRSPIEYQVHI